MYPRKQTNSWTFLPNTWHNGKSLLAPTSQLDSEFQLHLTPKGVKIWPKLHFSDISNTTKTSTILSTDHTETFLTFCRCRQFQDLTDKQVQMLDIQLCSNITTNLGSTIRRQVVRPLAFSPQSSFSNHPPESLQLEAWNYISQT